MKILHVQQTLSPRYGGPAIGLPQLARAQANAGHEVVIVTTNADYPRGIYCNAGWKNLEDSSVQVLYGAVQYVSLCFSTQIARYLSSSIKQFDIVHVHGLYRFPPTYAAYQARKQNVPYIIRPHGSIDPYLYSKSSRSLWLKRLYERWFDLPNLRGASAIQYTAEDERSRASFLGLQVPSFIVPNGLNWNTFQTLPTRGALRARYSLGEAPVILFLGRLHSVKGLDILIPAFDALRHEIPKVQLIIAGPENDSYGEQVRDWVHRRGLKSAVHFVGPLEGQDVVQAYVDADIFVLPSYSENFGLTIVEAMACALPVLISDQVKIHAEISRAGAGIVTRCDAAEVVIALKTLWYEPQRRLAMGNAGRKLVQDRYIWPSIVEKLTTEYESLLQSRRESLQPT